MERDPQEIRYTYDGYKRLKFVEMDSDTAPRYSYEYGANGETAQVTDALLGRTAVSEYDLSNRPTRIIHRENGGHLYTGTVQYDGYNNLSQFEEQIGTDRAKYTTTFSYDSENKPLTVQYGDTSHKVSYTYDSIGRVTGKNVRNGSISEASYQYADGGYPDSETENRSTTELIERIEQGAETFSYTYDDVGNIMTVTRGTGTDAKTTTYEYDSLGQLIRVNDPHDVSDARNGATWTYGYDLGGNILEKKRYAYTEGEILTEAEETVTYIYGNANWKDQLTGMTVTHRETGTGDGSEESE